MTGQPREYGQSNASAEQQNGQENTEILSKNLHIDVTWTILKLNKIIHIKDLQVTDHSLHTVHTP